MSTREVTAYLLGVRLAAGPLTGVEFLELATVDQAALMTTEECWLCSKLSEQEFSRWVLQGWSEARKEARP